MDDQLHRSLGLTDDELAKIIEILGRDPNHLELAMYSVMWSEHCSYKSSRIHLKRLPTEGKNVLVGPGENAGVIDVGDGIAIALRIESHNHPSYIEPYQGAATGVGGIIRDIFTMGARPIAIMDPLRFGPLEDARSRWVAEGVVSGISGYGNSVGVPNVGGEIVFDETYKGNPLVNVLCVGILPKERLVLGQASGIGNLAVLLGSTTGRDGIGGVSVLASAGFGDEEEDAEKRPSVQVGDPFEEKRLIEACLELLDEGLVVGIQDLGGAGLACAASETASRGGVGMDFNVSAVPQRESGMQPFEIMTSESQERMLAIVEPENLEQVFAICNKWEIRSSVVGKVTPSGALRIVDDFDGEVLGEVPAASLHEDAPLYERPISEPDDMDTAITDQATTLSGPEKIEDDLFDLLMSPQWATSQYDSQLFLNTVVGPGSNAAVLRLKHPTSGEDTGRGMALTTDGNHRWCAINPRIGSAMTVAESVLNLACVGAVPQALVNCLNFGNPENPVVMWQLSEAVDGMAEACNAFDLPVVGGNVSLYNESQGTNIDPTPIVGVIGLINDLSKAPPGLTWNDGDRIILLGPEANGLNGSAWAFMKGHRRGSLDPIDFDLHKRVCALTRDLVTKELVTGLHDISTGGLGVSAAEMAINSGVGCTLARTPDHIAFFSESPSRVILAVNPELLTEVEQLAAEYDVPHERIGLAHGEIFTVKNLLTVPVKDLQEKWDNRLSDALDGGTTQG
ncbi:MAG: phosphoribosylformylglycinamidine synthase subunit PurL [Acidimicrobiales bacterium]|nr:phosphoribosylformylglycinamidine synthase subunit PurL [Acidimicrobiales bacterium]